MGDVTSCYPFATHQTAKKPRARTKKNKNDATEDPAPAGARAVVVLLMTAVLTWSPFRVWGSVEGFRGLPASPSL